MSAPAVPPICRSGAGKVTFPCFGAPLRAQFRASPAASGFSARRETRSLRFRHWKQGGCLKERHFAAKDTKDADSRPGEPNPHALRRRIGLRPTSWGPAGAGKHGSGDSDDPGGTPCFPAPAGPQDGQREALTLRIRLDDSRSSAKSATGLFYQKLAFSSV